MKINQMLYHHSVYACVYGATLVSILSAIIVGVML